MVKIQKVMKKPALTVLRIVIIIVCTLVTVGATASSWEALGLLIAGMIFRNFFSSKIYDPIFKDQSMQSWVFSGIKKWATRKRPKFKFDI